MKQGFESPGGRKRAAAVWGIWLCVALFLHWGPPVVRQSLETGIVQMTGGLLAGMDSAARFGAEWFPFRRPAVPATAEPDPELVAENRRLTLLAAELQEKLSRLEQLPPPLPPERDDSLLQPDFVTARVVGVRRGDSRDDLRLLLALGRHQGVLGEELVLNSPGVLIDRGNGSGLSRDLLVHSGEGLFDLTVEVGRWTTAVQPLTDPAFRIAVRIVRHSPLGPVFGSRGILSGTGNGCRLDEVPATAPVAVGDFVYTEAYLSPAAEALYCGRVSRVEIADHESRWTIDVEPLYAAGEIPRDLRVLTLHPADRQQPADR